MFLCCDGVKEGQALWSGHKSCRDTDLFKEKQGRIHGNPVADGWAGAVMQKPLAIQKCYGGTDGLTDGPTDTARCRVACPRPINHMVIWKKVEEYLRLFETYRGN